MITILLLWGQEMVLFAFSNQATTWYESSSIAKLEPSKPRVDSETAEKPSGFVPTHPWKSSNESNLIATTTRTPLRDFTIETSIRKFPSTIILQWRLHIHGQSWARRRRRDRRLRSLAFGRSRLLFLRSKLLACHGVYMSDQLMVNWWWLTML